MVESVGLSTIALRREAIGSLTLEGVERGKWRYLTKDEVRQLIED
jgi:16S rRNA U516 pseudouridylate synthase RsuA-like enzyme